MVGGNKNDTSDVINRLHIMDASELKSSFPYNFIKIEQTIFFALLVFQPGSP